MSDDRERDRLLEIYKLHAELADRVSQRRDNANRLYATLHVALIALLAAIARFGAGGHPMLGSTVIVLVGLFGISLSLCWRDVIRSHKQLNSGKFEVLHDLETRLPYRFFTDEWNILKKGQDDTIYRKLTVSEQRLPSVFIVLYFLISASGVAFQFL